MKALIDIDTSLPLNEISEIIKNYIYEQDGIKVIEERKPRKESRSVGHPPHWDTGMINHMKQVGYSASVLTSNDFDGGEFMFLDECDRPTEVFGKSEHYGKALIYDISHKHMVTAHRGRRDERGNVVGKREVYLFFYKFIES